jgi:hypothetical protein
LENSRLVEHSIGATDELSDHVMDAVQTVLEQASVNARKRKIIWADGQKLSINQSVNRIHADQQGLPIELIEFHLLGWLEQVVVSPFHSEQQLAELDRLIGRWIEAHEKQAGVVQESTRTRHS